MDLDAMERTVASLHAQEPAFDWVGRTRSEVVAPIVLEGQVLGVLDVDSNTLDAFGERAVHLVEGAAEALAAAAG